MIFGICLPDRDRGGGAVGDGDVQRPGRLAQRGEERLGQIDVQLKRRHDLIPNLVETVKGYMGHERGTLEAVTKARQQAIEVTGGVEERAKAENALSQTLRSLFAVAEAYPDLKANQNFLALQEELTSTENKITFARQYYNDAVHALQQHASRCSRRTSSRACSTSSRRSSSRSRRRRSARCRR